MKLAAITFAFHPDICMLKDNILKYINGIEHLIIWDNTPDSVLQDDLGFSGDLTDKITFLSTGRNEGIASATNRAAVWAAENGFSHLLTMDQDSTWEDFSSYRKHIEESDERETHLFAPVLEVNGEIRENDPQVCFTSGMVVPMKLFFELGLFREDYFIDAVDYEFCYRCREAGYDIKYFPDILHHSLGRKTTVLGRYSTFNYSPFRLYFIARNNMFLWKDYKKTDIGHISLPHIHRMLYYHAKHIILGEENRSEKIRALMKGYAAGLKYRSGKKRISRLDPALSHDSIIDCSIIIVTFNTRQMTEECIDSIIEKTSGLSYEIIIVDNASEDGSREQFSKDGRVIYIYNQENSGFGKANNIGVRAARGRNILFLNSDTILINNAVKILSDYLDDNPGTGACGGNLFNADGQPGFSFGRQFPSISFELNSLTRNILTRLLFRKNISFNYSDTPLNVGYILGADLMIRNSFAKKHGAFDPDFFMYYEDVELCHRIKKNGFKVKSVPSAEITHLWGATTKSNEKIFQYYLRNEESRRIFLKKAHSRFYRAVADRIRLLTYASKKLSPSAEVRRSGKLRLDAIRQAADRRH